MQRALWSVLMLLLVASGPVHAQHQRAHGGPGPQQHHYQPEHPQHRLARWYAGESMRQIEQGRYMNCGFAGQRWVLDWELHYRWALRASPNRVYRQVDERDRHLARCRSNKLRHHRQDPPRPH